MQHERRVHAGARSGWRSWVRSGDVNSRGMGANHPSAGNVTIPYDPSLKLSSLVLVSDANLRPTRNKAFNTSIVRQPDCVPAESVALLGYNTSGRNRVTVGSHRTDVL